MGKCFKVIDDILIMDELIKENLCSEIFIYANDLEIYSGNLLPKFDLSSFNLAKGVILKLYLNINNLKLFYDKEVYGYNSFEIEKKDVYKYISRFKDELYEVIKHDIN